MMKRIFLFLLIIFLTTASFSYTDSIINDIEQFSKYFPRTEGSSNERETINLIKVRLETLGVSYSEIDFSDSEGFHSFSSYIELEIPGQSKESLITIVPVESSYGISAALHLTEYFQNNNPQLTMKFIFLGAESSPDSNLGTRNFLEHFYPESAAAFIYFNFKSPPESIGIRSGSDGYSSPFFLYNSIRTALAEAGIPFFHSNTESLLFRLSAVGSDSMLRDYLENGYPAIELYSHETAGNTSEPMIDGSKLIGFYIGFTKLLTDGIPQDWDGHYLFGLSEQQYIIIYIVILMLLMVYPIFRRKHFGWYMKTLRKSFWNLPLLFGLIFGILSLMSIILSLLLDLTGFPGLWEYRPLAVFLLKITIALLVYNIIFRQLSRLPFSRKSSFYSISAIFLLVIALFVLTLINLSLSFFALWPLFFIFLLTVFRQPVLKLLMLLISTIWIFFSLIGIFTMPSLSVIELITLSPVYGNLLISLIIMPFILAAIRLEMLAPIPGKLTRILPIVLSTTSLVLLGIILFYSPFSEANPQPVSISQELYEDSGKTEIDCRSPKQLPPETEKEIISAVSTSEQSIPDINIDMHTKAFLNRKIINASIALNEPVESLSLTLNSAEPLTLYESNFPAQWLPSQKRLEVFIGNNPPLPLEISLTLNRTAEPEYIVRAEFAKEIIRTEIDGRAYLVSRRRSVIKNYSDE